LDDIQHRNPKLERIKRQTLNEKIPNFISYGVLVKNITMILTIILSTKQVETNWNALRLANMTINKEDEVNIFLIGEGVEYLKSSNDKFNIQKQVDTFLESGKGKIFACETCLVSRNQKGDTTCPASGMKELYFLIKESDKVITF